WPLLRAARGALADSIAHHVTAANLVCVVVMAAAAAVLPVVLRRIGRRWFLAGVAACIVLVPLGPLASARIEARGPHRHCFAALVATALPRITPIANDADWQASPLGSPESDDLRWLRGLAAGRNVVLIHLESTGARYLSPYGAAEDPMPNLTGLCEQGILFE